jgi:hypothetical protein
MVFNYDTYPHAHRYEGYRSDEPSTQNTTHNLHGNSCGIVDLRHGTYWLSSLTIKRWRFIPNHTRISDLVSLSTICPVGVILDGSDRRPCPGSSRKGPVVHSTSGYNLPYAFLTLGIIIYGYFSRVALLFPGLVSRSVLRIREGQPWLAIDSKLAKLESLSETSAKQLVRKLASLGRRLIYSLTILIVAGKQLYGTRTWEVNYWNSILLGT